MEGGGRSVRGEDFDVVNGQIEGERQVHTSDGNLHPGFLGSDGRHLVDRPVLNGRQIKQHSQHYKQ